MQLSSESACQVLGRLIMMWPLNARSFPCLTHGEAEIMMRTCVVSSQKPFIIGHRQLCER